MTKTTAHTCQTAEASAQSLGAPSTGLIARLKVILHILREVLRGFAAGQPPDDARPRKGCC